MRSLRRKKVNMIKTLRWLFFLFFLTSCFENSLEDRVERIARRAIKYEENGQYEKALIEINRAINLDSNISSLYVIRGRIRRFQKFDSLSLVDYTKAINLDSANTSALFQKAFSYSLLNEEDSAIKYYNLSIKSKKSGQFFVNIENQDMLKLIHQNDISLPTIRFYRAISYYSNKQDSLAMKDFLFSLRSQFNTAECQFYLGVILASSGKKEGCDYLKLAIENGLNEAESYLYDLCK